MLIAHSRALQRQQPRGPSLNLAPPHILYKLLQASFFERRRLLEFGTHTLIVSSAAHGETHQLVIAEYLQQRGLAQAADPSVLGLLIVPKHDAFKVFADVAAS